LQEELVTGSDALYSYRNWRVTSLGTGGTGLPYSGKNWREVICRDTAYSSYMNS